ncbi:hypothetical protein [Streptomyces sp. NPDC002779]|uniref:hypothetical protein n=1 Tax=Streptomyces sp. NPDC002779 TaxID=3364664 RepID=UPI0036B58FCC
MRATAEEFADPSFDRMIRALNTEIANDAALAAEYREKLAQPLEEAKRARLRSAQRGHRPSRPRTARPSLRRRRTLR